MLNSFLDKLYSGRSRYTAKFMKQIWIFGPFGPFGFTHRSKTADASANVAVDEELLKSEEATEAAVAEAVGVAAGPAVAVGSKGPRGRQGMGDIRPPPPPHEDAFERVRGLIVNSGLSG